MLSDVAPNVRPGSVTAPAALAVNEAAMPAEVTSSAPLPEVTLTNVVVPLPSWNESPLTAIERSPPDLRIVKLPPIVCPAIESVTGVGSPGMLSIMNPSAIVPWVMPVVFSSTRSLPLKETCGMSTPISASNDP